MVIRVQKKNAKRKTAEAVFYTLLDYACKGNKAVTR